METSFLDDEVRCEFRVSKKRKQIWEIELSLIKELQRVCEKYQLRYYASNGTLLGAIRHNGFVPWDDDVDLMMPRPDYEKLLSIADKEFQSPFFFQTAHNDQEYFRNYGRLRNKETTALTSRGWEKKSCHGIFIDIFPIDGSYNNSLCVKWQSFLIKGYCALANTYVYYDEFKPSFIRKLLYWSATRYCHKHSFQHLLQRIENLRSRVSFETAKNVYVICHGGSTIYFPKSYLGNGITKDFEYLKLNIPKEYDKLLTLHYGNYMELPPMEKRGVHHSIFFDPEHSYREYQGRLRLEDAKKQFNDY